MNRPRFIAALAATATAVLAGPVAALAKPPIRAWEYDDTEIVAARSLKDALYYANGFSDTATDVAADELTPLDNDKLVKIWLENHAKHTPPTGEMPASSRVVKVTEWRTHVEATVGAWLVGTEGDVDRDRAACVASAYW